MAPALAMGALAPMIPQLIEATNSLKNRIGTPIIEFGLDDEGDVVHVNDKRCTVPIRVSPATILTIGGLALLFYIIVKVNQFYDPGKTGKGSIGGNIVKQLEDASGKDLGSWLWW